MTRLPGHGPGTTRSFHQVITLGVPPRTLPAIDLGVIAELKPRGPVSVLEEDIGGGAYLFAGDRSGVRAWIPYFERTSPAQSTAAVMAWLAANGVEARFCGRAREPYPDAPPETAEVRITLPAPQPPAPPAASAAPKPAPAQLDLFG